MKKEIKYLYKDIIRRKLGPHDIFKEWCDYKRIYIERIGKPPATLYPKIVRMVKKYECKD